MHVRIFHLLVGLAFGLASSRGIAADIDPSCLASFNVKDKSFSAGNSTMSCKLLEIRRTQIFAAINAIPATGSIDGADVAGKLHNIEQDLQDL